MTFGAPLGAFTSNLGGAFASRASSSVASGYCGSAIGSTVRSSPVAGAPPVAAAFVADSGALQPTAPASASDTATNL